MFVEKIKRTREEIIEFCRTKPEQAADIIIALSTAVERLEERVKKLEEQLNKNSQNSHKPPSSDGYKRKINSSAPEKKQRSNGGQAGHKGTTLRKSSTPDHIVLHSVNSCISCGASLEEVTGHKFQSRQVFDLPSVKIEVTEHRSEVKHCPCCHKENVAAFPAGVGKAVQYGPTTKAIVLYMMQHHLIPYERATEFLRDIFGCELSEGTLKNWIAEANTLLETPQEQIKEQLQQAEVVNVDETGMFCDNKLQWIHSVSTEQFTYYGIHNKRGKEAMDAIGILPKIQGRIVHDFWESYLGYDQCMHAYCNAHIVRELRALYEQHNQQWIKELIDLLFEINNSVQSKKLSKNKITRNKKRYDELIVTGMRLHPKNRGEPHLPGRIKQSKARNLLERLRDHRDEVLAFMYDPRVPFTNNLAERDLRMVKVKQKISGTFRSQDGAQYYCRIRSYISTMKKQSVNILSALSSVFMRNPLSPVPQFR